MKSLEILIRSTLFNIAFIGVTFVMMIFTLPATFMPRRIAMKVVRLWVNSVHRLERLILNLDYEVRGLEHLPHGQSFLVAAKHQSAYETMKLHILFDDPAIVLKKELLSIPMWGRFLKKIDPVAIDRSNKEEAMKSLLAGVESMKNQSRPIVIFPQGTRVHYDATTDEKPYKAGIAKMYASSGLPIVPMALNTGIFWPRTSWIKRPGKIVFEFLPSIEPGIPLENVMKTLTPQLESASNTLREEARQKYPWLPRKSG